MRVLIAVAGLILMAGCMPPPPPHVVVDGEDIICESARMTTDQNLLAEMRVVADAQINTTDPAEVAKLEHTRADAKAQLQRLQRVVAECDSAVMVQ